MAQILFNLFMYLNRVMNFFLTFDIGLGFSLGHLIIVSLIFTAVIRYFTVLGN